MTSGRIRALLVEDSRIVARLLTQILDLEGGRNIEIVHKERLADAASVVKQEAFDVLLLDLSLPDSAGMETIIRARSLCPCIPIVVLSSEDDDGIRREAMRVGAAAYLVKGDASGAMIMQAINHAVASRPQEP